MDTAALVTRILDAAATELDQHATMTHPIGRHEIPQCMTDGWLDLAVRRALWPALGEVRGWNRVAVQAAVGGTVRATLPPVAGTVAEYADQIRNLANDRRLATVV